MGYTTEFDGQIEIVPPLSQELAEYINKFSETRRMMRNTQILIDRYGGNNGFNGGYGIDGEYFVGGLGFGGQDRDDSIVAYNDPPSTQPGLWCQWRITEDGKFIEWDGGEKFYNAEDWMEYIINNFIKKDHVCNGSIIAQGEEISDRWELFVTDNAVSTVNLR